MRFAIGIPQLYPDGSFSPSDFKSYLARVEELGVYESAWTQEMVLGAAPQLAPLEVMTYAAACTSTLRLGCTVFVTTLHTPAHLAKSLASLDQLSGGRLEVGIGSGGPRRPFAAFGMSAMRWLPRFTEGVALMKALWTEPSVTFDGEFWQLKEAAMEPKPYQKPYPRLWFGGSAPAAVRRGVGLCDGFFGAGSSATSAFAAQVAVVRETLAGSSGPAARRVGFGPGEFPIAKRVYLGVDPTSGARARDRMNDALARMYGARNPAIESAAVAGTVAECVDGVRAVIEAGAEMVLFTPLYDNVEHMELIADQIIPALGSLGSLGSQGSLG
jgi:alkanesulfonate monooxygenase SsuD/methylene tetrahydromethanopterin reductase-like flavin-dependent oxidoreductase (luciferase family)